MVGLFVGLLVGAGVVGLFVGLFVGSGVTPPQKSGNVFLTTQASPLPHVSFKPMVPDACVPPTWFLSKQISNTWSVSEHGWLICRPLTYVPSLFPLYGTRTYDGTDAYLINLAISP